MNSAFLQIKSRYLISEKADFHPHQNPSKEVKKIWNVYLTQDNLNIIFKRIWSKKIFSNFFRIWGRVQSTKNWQKSLEKPIYSWRDLVKIFWLILTQNHFLNDFKWFCGSKKIHFLVGFLNGENQFFKGN